MQKSGDTGENIVQSEKHLPVQKGDGRNIRKKHSAKHSRARRSTISEQVGVLFELVRDRTKGDTNAGEA